MLVIQLYPWMYIYIAFLRNFLDICKRYPVKTIRNSLHSLQTGNCNDNASCLRITASTRSRKRLSIHFRNSEEIFLYYMYNNNTYIFESFNFILLPLLTCLKYNNCALVHTIIVHHSPHSPFLWSDIWTCKNGNIFIYKFLSFIL